MFLFRGVIAPFTFFRRENFVFDEQKLNYFSVWIFPVYFIYFLLNGYLQRENTRLFLGVAVTREMHMNFTGKRCY